MAEISTLNGYKIKDKKAKRYYDSVNSMKNDTTLKNGMMVQTKGFYESNDGGSGLYEIIEDVNLIVDDGIIHQLTNGLKAKLISNMIFPETIGCIVDGETDNSVEINKLLEIGAEYNYNIGFKKIYYVSNPILLPANYSINFNNTEIVALSNLSGVIKCDSVDSNNQNAFISNLTINLNNIATKGIYLNSCWRRTIEHIKIINLPINSIGLHIDTGKGGGNLFSDIRGETTNNPTTFIKNNSDDNTFKDCDYQNFSIGFETTAFARLFNLHGYIDDSNIYDSSYFIKLLGSGRIFADNLYPDTQKYVFYTESTQPNQIGNVYYNFNTNVIDNVQCTIFATNTNTKWYRTYVNNLLLSIPSTITPTIIAPMHTGLNDSVITINNIIGSSDHKYELPFKYLKLDIDESNFDRAGANEGVLILKGQCPNSVTGSNKLIAEKNLYTNFDLINGYYLFIGLGGASSDEQYTGTAYVNDGKVYIMPHEKQGANFKFNIIIPIVKTSNNS